MRFVVLGLCLLSAVLLFSFPHLLFAASAKQVICPEKIFWTGESTFSLTKIEQTFVCGDPEVEAYSEIPLNQAQYFLKNFLQDRGYHRPQFSLQNNQLFVNSGPLSLSTKIQVHGDPPFLEMYKKRKVMDRPLTPKLLNEIQDWIRSRLRAEGYACPELTTTADIETGIIDVNIIHGPKQKVLSVIQESVEGLGPGALRKYDAFQLDKGFNDDLLELTSTRVEDSGVLQTSFFTWNCETETKGIELYQRTFAGKPRIFKLGFGGSTEELAIIRASWKHARWGKNASNFLASLYASYRQQYIDLTSEWYAFSPLSRWFVQPNLNFTHERESDFQYLSGSVQAALGTTYDNQTLGLRVTAGPNLNFTRTFEGARPGLTQFLTLRYELDLMSHYWEIFQKDPQEGYHIYLTGDFGTEALFSSISAQRFRLEGQYLYNLRDYDPALLIIGIRGGLYSTLAAQNENTLDILPPNYKYYLGGSLNLRGFGRKELPNADGALSALWGGLEIRLANYIPYWIEPFLFIDVGIMGNQAFVFNSPVYYSPGAGIRVDSPIGVFRTTFAHGFKSSESDGNLGNTHFQFYITYGEEF